MIFPPIALTAAAGATVAIVIEATALDGAAAASHSEQDVLLVEIAFDGGVPVAVDQLTYDVSQGAFVSETTGQSVGDGLSSLVYDAPAGARSAQVVVTPPASAEDGDFVIDAVTASADPAMADAGGAGVDVAPMETVFSEGFEGPSSSILENPFYQRDGKLVANGDAHSGTLLLEPVSLDGVENAELRIDVRAVMQGASFDKPGSKLSDYVIVELATDGGAFEVIDEFHYNEGREAFVSSSSGQSFANGVKSLRYDVPDGAAGAQVRITATATGERDEQIEIHAVEFLGDPVDEVVSDASADAALLAVMMSAGDAAEDAASAAVGAFAMVNDGAMDDAALDPLRVDLEQDAATG